jgi:tetratricopeptide (TPR) repeat protein
MPAPSPGPRPWRGLFFLAALALTPVVAAAPYVPSSDAEVLETLPPGAPSANRRAEPPRDPGAAAVLARGYIERARATGDPRFLGYAEGVLAPWWDEGAPPPPVLLLRATLLQSRHRFDLALRDLDALLRLEPRSAQAWLTRATILRVQGEYAKARASCERLDGLTEAFITDLCAASVRGLAGELPAMAAALEALAPESGAQAPGVRAWYLAERAEMAERLGRDDQALVLYREALASGAADPLLRAAAADLLLRRGRAKEALEFIGTVTEADVLRLRLALARRALGRPDVAVETALAEGYAAARRRGEDLHLREEARFALEIAGDADRALDLAQRNWATQREPADALILLQAARADDDDGAARAVRAWLREAGMQDARLSP